MHIRPRQPAIPALWGCPFAAQLMQSLRARVAADRSLRDRVRFAGISFDPTHDTPEVLRLQGGGADGFDWRYFTTRSVRELLPLLDGFDIATLVLEERGRTAAR